MTKGVKGFQKGHKHSEETKSKIGASNRKRVIFSCDYCGEQSDDKPSSYNRAKRHFCSRGCYSRFREEKLPVNEQHAWKGGIAKENQRGRGTKQYKQWMKSVLDNCDGLCVCGDKAEECHHIKGWTEYPELRFDIDNGVALCKPCHYKVHYENQELLEDA